MTSDRGDWVTGVRRAAGCFSEELRAAAAAAAVLHQRAPLPSVPPPFPRLIHPSHRDTCVVRRGSRWADLEQFNSRPWASVTHLRMDLYLQRRTRKQLVNPFSLRPLICSYLLQQPKKSQGIFSSLLPIDPALRKSALLSKHY